jgi:hypothetical protein
VLRQRLIGKSIAKQLKYARFLWSPSFTEMSEPVTGFLLVVKVAKGSGSE